MKIAWIYLFFAGLLEIGWAVGLKYTEGFTRLWPSIGTVISLTTSIFLLAKAAQILPIGTAYTIWVGIGALGTAILGICLFQESASAVRLICLSMLVCSIIGLKLSS